MLVILKTRFTQNPIRHPDLAWENIEKRLRAVPGAPEIPQRMEESGGVPDVIGVDGNSGEAIFCDCSKESPVRRRSQCYDDALQKRAKKPPHGSALHQAREMGIELMTESFCRKLQTLGEFDLKTSFWIATPDEVRKLGGSLFCERRYGVVFTFHNGADSYYSVRGWRGYLKA